MDPITTAIIAALSAGAAGGIKDTAQKAIADSYNWIKNTIKEKFSHKKGLIDALEKIETAPDHKAAQEALSKEIIAAGVHQDTELLKGVKELMNLEGMKELMDMVGKKQTTIARYSIQAENIQGIVQAEEIQSLTQNFGEIKK